MSTRAIQDSLQLLGFRDPVLDTWLSGGTVEFYSAGTTNLKEGWEDKDKATPITSVTLDSSGQAQVYFDGVYKLVVKNAAGTVKYTLDNLKYQANNSSTLTKSADYQVTAEDDYILVDTDSGPVTITLAPVAGVVAPVTIKNIGTSGNDVTVDGSGSELIDGALTQTLLDAASQQYVTDGTQWYGAGISTGITFTSTSLVSGTNNTFDEAAGVTTVNVPAASNTTKGAIEIATDAEVLTGTSEILAVNPKQVKAAVDLIEPFNSKAMAHISTIPVAMTYARTLTLVTVTSTAHGLTTGHIVDLDFTTGTATDGSYTITVVDVDTYTVVDTLSGTTSGNVTQNTVMYYGLNVTRIEDQGVGRFRVVYTIPFSDTFYVPMCSTSGASAGSILGAITIYGRLLEEYTDFSTTDGGTTPQDNLSTSIVVFGNQ